jgi:hypothetical protein
LGYVTPAEFEVAALAQPRYPLLNPGCMVFLVHLLIWLRDIVTR